MTKVKHIIVWESNYIHYIKQPWPVIHTECFGRELKQNNATVCPDVN